MNIVETLQKFGRVVAYHVEFARALKSTSAGLLLSQLLYWQGKSKNPKGVYKTAKDLTEETCLSVQEQRTARKKLRDAGILIETKERTCMLNIVWYRIDYEALEKLLSSHACEEQEEVFPSVAGNTPTVATNSPSVAGNTPTVASNTYYKEEITTEITTENNTPSAQAPLPTHGLPETEQPDQTPRTKPKVSKVNVFDLLTQAGADARVVREHLEMRQAKGVKQRLNQDRVNAIIETAQTLKHSLTDVLKLMTLKGWASIGADWAEVRRYFADSNRRATSSHSVNQIKHTPMFDGAW